MRMHTDNLHLLGQPVTRRSEIAAVLPAGSWSEPISCNQRATTIDVCTPCHYSAVVKFEWNEAKRQANIRKHGIDFVDIELLFEGCTVTMEDDRFEYDEHRFVTFGSLTGRVIAVVHTESENTIRVISARKATKNEEECYFSKISD